MTEELISKITKAIQATGIPLELEIAAVARQHGWVDFHSVEYTDPETEKMRELDLLLYKIINGRRIELRVSCKSSISKQFIFFTHRDTSYHNLSSIKITPVSDNLKERRSIPHELRSIRFFSHDHLTVNYTVLTGDRVDREARTLLRDGLLSVVTSIHHRILPNELLQDPRGKIVFFMVILRGGMYDARYSEANTKMIVNECDYARWRGLIPIPQRYYRMMIPDSNGQQIPFSNVLYWFGNELHVEFIKDTLFESYLIDLENSFNNINLDQYTVFGKSWTPENFPKTVGPKPSLKPVKVNDQQNDNSELES